MPDFDKLRVTTMQVTAPYLALCKHRGEMAKQLIEYIQSLNLDTLEFLEIIEKYNVYAHKDQRMIDILQGRLEEID